MRLHVAAYRETIISEARGFLTMVAWRITPGMSRVRTLLLFSGRGSK